MKGNWKKIKLSLVLFISISTLLLVLPFPSAYAAVPTVQSAKITGTNTIVIVYSEPVITVALEYTDLRLTAGGARNIVLLIGSGTDTITLTFDGAAAAVDETATIDITGPVSVSTAQPLVPLNDHPITDGQVPLATNPPTAAAGPIIDAAEEAAGFNVIAPLGVSTAVAGDTLELLLGGSSFPIQLTRILTAGDIGAGQYSFNIASGQLGADGLKSITSRVTDIAGNVGPQSLPLVLTLDAGITPPSTNNSYEQISHTFQTVYPQQITFSQDLDTILTGKKYIFDAKMDTKTIKINEPFDLKISFPNNHAFQNIHNIQLIFDIYENSIKNEKGLLIIYDKYSGFNTIDKNELFSSVSYNIHSDKNSIELIFTIIFQKQIDNADFTLQYIDLVKNSRTIKIPNAIKVVEKIPIDLSFKVDEPFSDTETDIQVNRYDFIIMENEGNGIITPDFNLLERQVPKSTKNDKPTQWYELLRYQSEEKGQLSLVENKKVIPSGIKEQAFWWANGKFSDSQFLKGIKYLENQGFLVISYDVKPSSAQKIPDWLKLDNKWWDSQKMVSDELFISTMVELFKK